MASHRATAVAALQEGPGSLQAVEATHALVAGVQEDTLRYSWLVQLVLRSESPQVSEVHDLQVKLKGMAHDCNASTLGFFEKIHPKNGRRTTNLFLD